jgi:hypothetical protein
MKLLKKFLLYCPLKKFIKHFIGSAIIILIAIATDSNNAYSDALNVYSQSNFKTVMVGKNNPIQSPSNNHSLAFGQEVVSSNSDMCVIVPYDDKLSFGRAWNVTNSGARLIFFTENRVVGIENWNPDGANNVKLDVSGHVRS